MALALFLLFYQIYIIQSMVQTQMWGQFELILTGPAENNTFNPFESNFGANFTYKSNTSSPMYQVNGFYDGNTTYKVRFMPLKVGEWTYITWSTIKQLAGKSGTLNCTASASSNFGVAYVNKSSSTSSFTWSQTNQEYFSVGTTSYAWIHYPNITIVNNTMKELQYVANNNIFNKLRFSIFPKWYRYTHIEPLYYPYVSNTGPPPLTNTTNWNFKKFNVTFWQYLDELLTETINKLNNGNFIMDIILFHPYDYGHWGFDCMGGRDPQTYNIANDEFYLKYVTARLSSYRNIWWSMANEFNLINCKNQSLPKSFPIWDNLFKKLIEYDVYGEYREKSIHQAGNVIYNYSQPWTTHFSIQSYDNVPYNYFQNEFNVSKPVILDEVQYEGNLTQFPIDNLSAREETDRFWMANGNGNMCGHSEDLLPNSTDDANGTAILWNNFGNVLRGKSFQKIGWFYRYMINIDRHPPFNELHNDCILNQASNTMECLISRLIKKNNYYLIHWTNYTNTTYNTQINITLNGDPYQISYIDYMAETITVVNTTFVKKNFIFTPPMIPYNIEIINKNLSH